jgi:hypothetical protein
MNLEIITSKPEILKLHTAFEKLMKNNAEKKKRQLTFSSRGGGGRTDVINLPDENIWFVCFHRDKRNKFINLFGKNPDFKRNNNILIQINYQIEFKNFNDAAVWAKSPNGKIYLLHSGKMGGGVKGISMENVDNIYSGRRCDAYHNGKAKEYYIVCEITSPRAFNQVVAFVNEIERVKTILKSANETVPVNKVTGKWVTGKKLLILKKYTPEHWGKRKTYFNKGKVESVTNHGEVVHTLKEILENEMGFNGMCVNNKYIDLGLEKKNQPIAIFEIKTSVRTQALYTAVGQLMLHAYNSKTEPKKFIVMPDDLDKEIEKDLQVLGITTIRFQITKHKITFNKFNLNL